MNTCKVLKNGKCTYDGATCTYKMSCTEWCKIHYPDTAILPGINTGEDLFS